MLALGLTHTLFSSLFLYQSRSVGEKKEDGTYDKAINEGRTSTNAWCQHACYEDADAQRVIHRLSNLTGIPEPNSEYLQLLRYEKDQFYQAHHVRPLCSQSVSCTLGLFPTVKRHGLLTKFFGLHVVIKPSHSV